MAIMLVAGIASSHVAADIYRVEKQASGRWQFTTPTGQPFWSLGSCCVGVGAAWEKYDPKNPAYRAHRLFPNAKSWAEDTVQKLTSWGFNTVGGWSDTPLFDRYTPTQRLPYTVVLHLGAYYRAPWDDLFSQAALDAIDSAAKAQIVPIKDDPRLIGYFTDNELGWWDDTLFLSYVTKLPAGSPGRDRVHAMLREMYGSYAAFRADWESPAASWEEFQQKPALTLKPGGSGMRAVNRWMSVIGDHYYRTVRDAVRMYDAKHLILGDRYLQYYNQALAKTSAKYIDVCSTNMGSDFLDGTSSPFFLEGLHALTGKPIVISEFYMAATENRSGNKNSGTAFPVVKTQKQRAASFRRNLEWFAAQPFVIGAHWFQFTDEPTHGRGDGEDFNMGLLDIFGVPYAGMINASRSLDLKATLTRPPVPPKQISKVPSIRFNVMQENTLLKWPRESARVLSESKEPFGDLYVVQDEDALYLGLHAMNYIDESLYAGGLIPESERPHFQVSFGSGQELDVRFSGARGKGNPLPLAITGLNAKAIERHALKHTLIIRIPWSSLGGKRNDLAIRAKLDTHSRGETMTWQAKLPLK